MRRKLKRLFASILVLSMLMNLISVTTFADNTSCGLVEHTHTDDCYGEMIHWDVASDSNVASDSDSITGIRKLECGKSEHQHMAGCYLRSNGVSDEYIEELIKYIEETPTVMEMHRARKDFVPDTINDTQSLASARERYEEYVNNNLMRIASASDALSRLSDEEQDKVTNANKLLFPDEETIMPFNKYQADVGTAVNEYTFWLDDSHRYESSMHANSTSYTDSKERSSRGLNVGSFILVDASKYGDNWSPNGEYKPYDNSVENNYVVAYCSDWAVDAKGGTMYKRMNLEDSTYYTEENARHVRSIVMNAYPFISLEKMKDDLKNADNIGLSDAEIDSLTRSEVTTAAQIAIWYYSNNRSYYLLNYGYTRSPNRNESYHDLSYDGWFWHDDNSSNYNKPSEKTNPDCLNADSTARKHINSVMNYFLSLDAEPIKPTETIINVMDVVYLDSGEITDGLIPISLTIEFNSAGSESDDITIVAQAEKSEKSVTLSTKGGSKVHTLPELLVEAGDTITITLNGTQILPKGAYFYTPQPVYGENIDDPVREASQNLVGIAMGETRIGAQTTYNVADSAEIIINKIDDVSKNGIYGAEFTLYHVHEDYNDQSNANEVITEVGTHIISEGNNVIGGLLPNRTYELKETKAPKGYHGLGDSEVIRFTVGTDKTITIDGTKTTSKVSYDTVEGDFVVTVPNEKKEDINISVKKVWDGTPLEGHPTRVNVQLQKGDIPVGEIISLSQDNNWSYTWEKKFEYDLEYIDSGITFIGDIKIILQTIGKVLKRSDTVREGTASDMDFGDWLMQEGKVDQETYDAKQTAAKDLLGV